MNRFVIDGKDIDLDKLDGISKITEIPNNKDQSKGWKFFEYSVAKRRTKVYNGIVINGTLEKCRDLVALRDDLIKSWEKNNKDKEDK